MKNYSKANNNTSGSSSSGGGGGFLNNGNNNCNANATESTKLLSGARRITSLKGISNDDSSNDLYYGDEQRIEDIRSSINIGYASIKSGESTNSDIEHQNSVLEDSKRNVDSINSMAESAREVIRTWQCNIYRKRFYLWSIAIVLFIIDMSLLVYMMRHHGRLY